MRHGPPRDSDRAYREAGEEEGTRLGSAIINTTLLMLFLAVLCVILKLLGAL